MGGNDTTTGDKDRIFLFFRFCYQQKWLMLQSVHEFNPDDEPITAYLEWFKLFVSVNNVPADKLASMLLHVLGLKHYTLVRGLVSQVKPEYVNLEQLI